jgi:hypothetical protein
MAMRELAPRQVEVSAAAVAGWVVRQSVSQVSLVYSVSVVGLASVGLRRHWQYSGMVRHHTVDRMLPEISSVALAVVPVRH